MCGGEKGSTTILRGGVKSSGKKLDMFAELFILGGKGERPARGTKPEIM